MSNTKVSPRLATPDGPVLVSSAFCQEIFHTYGMKFCIDGRIECLTFELGFDLVSQHAARVEVALAHAGSS
jgi:hypothetical protein